MKRFFSIFFCVMLAIFTMFSALACANNENPTENPDQGTETPSDPDTPSNPGSGTDPSNPSTDDPSNPGGETDPSNPGSGTDPSNPGGGTENPSNPGGGTENPSNPGTDDPSNPGGETDPSTPSEPDDPSEKAGDVLVVHFSATNNTERVAGFIAQITGADTFEITPKEPYSSDDLDWTDSDSRVSREHNDESLRNVELVEDTPDGWENYKTVFIGYPIWWGIAAWPINGFIAANDFTGKTVIPFCTSSSSGLGQSAELLEEMAGTGTWLEGMRFRSSASESDVKTWVESLDLDFSENPSTGEDEGETEATATLTFEKSGDGYMVTGESGEASEIVIPSEYDGSPVIGIADSAFAYSRHTADIVSVTIPDSVATIGKNAFHNQDALVSVKIGTESELISIGSNAFSGCSALTSFYLPAGCVSLGYDATAPSFDVDGEDYIDSYGEVFNNCGALNEFTVGEGNTAFESMGGHLVYVGEKHNSEKVKILIRGVNQAQIPSGVTKIGKASFRKATLTTLTIPATVTVIDKYALMDCTELTSVNFEGSIDEWGRVTKGNLWNSGSDFEVTCSDGKIDDENA